MTVLNPGDRFPELTVSPPRGAELTLPDALSGDYGVVLDYRAA